MVTDFDDDIVDSLRQGTAPSGEALVSRRKQREVMYWRVFACDDSCPRHKNSKGWIQIGPKLSPNTAIEYTEFLESKHAEPLKDYGADAGRGPNGGGDMLEPSTRYDRILRAGGLKEFPDEQIIAYGWHKLEPVLLERPHLRDVPEYTCEYGCSDYLTTSERAYASHVKAMHPESAGARAVGDQVGKLLERVLPTSQPQALDVNNLAAVIAQAVLQYEREKTSTSEVILPSPEDHDDLDEVE